MTQGKPGGTRGILTPKQGEKNFRLSRVTPSSDLALFIEHYWMISWDLRGQQPYVSETLPFPSVHFAIENRRPEVYGVLTGRFTRRLQGQGSVFGVKFRPACFYPFFRAPLSKLTDRTASLRSIFGSAGEHLRKDILEESESAERIARMEEFLTERLPKLDSRTEEIRNAVESIATDRTILRVDQVASILGITSRPLQRAFEKYVGVSPKWVIQRYRLQEAAELLINGEGTMLDIALALGYFDQAHFIRDFRAVIGRTPKSYVAKNLGRSLK